MDLGSQLARLSRFQESCTKDTARLANEAPRKPKEKPFNPTRDIVQWRVVQQLIHVHLVISYPRGQTPHRPSPRPTKAPHRDGTHHPPTCENSGAATATAQPAGPTPPRAAVHRLEPRGCRAVPGWPPARLPVPLPGLGVLLLRPALAGRVSGLGGLVWRRQVEKMGLSRPFGPGI